MSDQVLDLSRSVHLIRRHLIWVLVAAAVGLGAGSWYGLRHPPMVSSTALVELPASIKDVTTQAVIADSDNVLAGALASIRPAVSLQTLQSRVHVTNLTANVLSISAEGTTPTQAERTANAVARSFVSYVGTSKGAVGRVLAQVLEPATTASGRSPQLWIAITAGTGALLGALIGAIGAIAFGRRDRRLQLRDQIADAIGVPVLASLRVLRPADAAGWTRLLDDYQPSASDAWRLVNLLRPLGIPDVAKIGANGRGRFSVMVLSLISDRRALALGPQLAVFAARQGVPTALVIGAGKDARVTAALRTACAAVPSPNRSGRLRVAVADHSYDDVPADAALTVVVVAVDDLSPQLANAIRTHATVLGVSAGAATAEQLARVAASAASEGHQIEGILISDPDETDQTTGRLPQLSRPARRLHPTRVTGVPTRAGNHGRSMERDSDVRR